MNPNSTLQHEPIIDPTDVFDLRPVTLGKASDLTGSGGDGEGDWANIVWGNF